MPSVSPGRKRQSNCRLNEELYHRIRRDADERGMKVYRVLEERLEESFDIRPEGIPRSHPRDS